MRRRNVDLVLLHTVEGTLDLVASVVDGIVDD